MPGTGQRKLPHIIQFSERDYRPSVAGLREDIRLAGTFEHNVQALETPSEGPPDTRLEWEIPDATDRTGVSGILVAAACSRPEFTQLAAAEERNSGWSRNWKVSDTFAGVGSLQVHSSVAVRPQRGPRRGHWSY